MTPSCCAASIHGLCGWKDKPLTRLPFVSNFLNIVNSIMFEIKQKNLCVDWFRNGRIEWRKKKFLLLLSDETTSDTEKKQTNQNAHSELFSILLVKRLDFLKI